MKILIVGLGSVGQRHARNLRALLGDRVELHAFRARGLQHVITPTLAIEPGTDVAAKYGFRVHRALDEALDQKPDAVFVTNPNSMHVPVAIAAAERGCHLFIEKPLSHNLDGVERLAEVVERRRLTCFVGYQLRFHPGLALIQSLLGSQAIGRVIAARLAFGEYLPDWHKYEDYRQYHAARKDQGGGVILSQIHDLDYAYALFGMPRRIFTLGGKLSTLDVDVEDTASILMECVVDGRPVPVHLHQDYVQKPPTRCCEIIGDRGKIVWEYFANRIVVTHRDRPEPEMHAFDKFERNQMFLDEVKHFLACIAGAEQPRVHLRDGANSLTMALAAKRSLERGEVVRLSAGSTPDAWRLAG